MVQTDKTAVFFLLGLIWLFTLAAQERQQYFTAASFSQLGLLHFTGRILLVF